VFLGFKFAEEGRIEMILNSVGLGLIFGGSAVVYILGISATYLGMSGIYIQCGDPLVSMSVSMLIIYIGGLSLIGYASVLSLSNPEIAKRTFVAVNWPHF
jgi:hypothetical protein